VVEDRPQRTKRWMAHSGHDRQEDRKTPHLRIEREPGR
jgi:hypothetical protein